jgi:ribosomal protein S18 acetylase RimI-like enzyme
MTSLKSHDAADAQEVVLVRRAVAADVGVLTALERVAFSSDALSSRSFKNLIGSTTADLMVAEQAGKVRGYALVLYRAKSSVGRIYSIAVDPNNVRGGIGSRLLRAAEQACVDRGMSRVRLEVDESNLAAISMYQRFGYRRVGRTEKYYENGAPALRMERRLENADFGQKSY